MRRIALALLLAMLLVQTAQPSMGRMFGRTGPGSGGGGPPPAESGITVDITTTKIQGATCVAPCVVIFDGSGTLDDAFATPVLTHRFDWDFDDSSGNFTVGSGTTSRDVDRGFLVAHRYDTAGTYAPTLKVTAPDGDQNTKATSVTVVDPDTEFLGTKTVCIAAGSLPVQNVGGCPLNAAVLNAGTAGNNGNTALADAKCQATVAVTKKRCLFKGGDTFTFTASSALSGGSTPGVIGSYGGSNAIFESPALAVATVLFLNSGWTITGLTIHSNGTGPPIYSGVLVAGGTITNLTVVGNTFTDGRYYSLEISTSALATPDSIAFVDNTASAATTGTVFVPAGLFLRGNHMVVQGNNIDANRMGQYMQRSVHMAHSVIAHNNYLELAESHNPLQIRAGAGPIAPDEYIHIADNLFEVYDNDQAGFIKLCEWHDCVTHDAASPGVQIVVIERNFARYHTGAAAAPDCNKGFVQGQARNIVVRNNGMDCQNAVSSSPFVFAFPDASGIGLTQDNWQVLNNTMYTTSAGSNLMTICSQGANVTASICRGNLSDTRVTGTKADVSGAGWTGTNNLITTAANPFDGTPGATGTTGLTDFDIPTGSAAKNAGYDYTGQTTNFVLEDATGGCRPDATEWDAGLDEFAATACP